MQLRESSLGVKKMYVASQVMPLMSHGLLQSKNRAFEMAYYTVLHTGGLGITSFSRRLWNLWPKPDSAPKFQNSNRTIQNLEFRFAQTISTGDAAIGLAAGRQTWAIYLLSVGRF